MKQNSHWRVAEDGDIFSGISDDNWQCREQFLERVLHLLTHTPDTGHFWEKQIEIRVAGFEQLSHNRRSSEDDDIFP